MYLSYYHLISLYSLFSNGPFCYIDSNMTGPPYRFLECCLSWRQCCGVGPCKLPQIPEFLCLCLFDFPLRPCLIFILSSKSDAIGFLTYSSTALHPASEESASLINFCLCFIIFTPSAILSWASSIFCSLMLSLASWILNSTFTVCLCCSSLPRY